MIRFRKLIPVRLVDIFTPSRACCKESYGELDESPRIDISRVFPVVKNSVMKLYNNNIIITIRKDRLYGKKNDKRIATCAVVSLALSGS